jgi:2-phosphosulfolactate phosphatase
MRVACEWGSAGAARPADVAIIVDVLSFSTCVCVAAERGARVFPLAGGGEEAAALAAAVGARQAGRREEGGLSLSPGSMERLTEGESVVLPSPNGGRCALAAKASDVLCGCLRNARAVAETAARAGQSILVVPAGEQWPDGAMRVSFEDLIGAGAIISALDGELSPEAAAAAAAFESARGDLAARLRACASGQDLIDRGFPQDVEAAAQLDASAAAPLLMLHRVRYGEAGAASMRADRRVVYFENASPP